MPPHPELPLSGISGVSYFWSFLLPELPLSCNIASFQNSLPSLWTKDPVHILVTLQRSERFCEDICDLHFCSNVGYRDLLVLYCVTYEVIANVYVLRALIIDRILGYSECALVVAVDSRRIADFWGRFDVYSEFLH